MRCPRLDSVFLTFGCALTTLSVYGGSMPQVQRLGSQLIIEWDSDGEGLWQILDNQNRLCKSGRMRDGHNVINLTKVASPSDLNFRLQARDGGSQVLQIPGNRQLSPLHKPAGAVVVYQLPVRTYLARGIGRDQTGRLADLTTDRLREIKQFGADYLWLTGVLEHASRSQSDPDVVKGNAGSYYAIYDNWDVSAQIGDLADFEAMIERAHAEGLRVIIDFVANHTARSHRTDIVCKEALDFGGTDNIGDFFDPNNNYFYIANSTFTPPLQSNIPDADGMFDTDIFSPDVQLESPARVTGNDIDSPSPSASHWFETVKLNYGYDFSRRLSFYSPRPKTWDQMIDVAQYWVEKGVDGFRIDFAHAVPVEFWRAFAQELKQVFPSVYLMAEAYENDVAMKVPGFTYNALLDAGFDSVYNSEGYWAMRNLYAHPTSMRLANPLRTPAFSHEATHRGFMFTHYMENHDEIRLASPHIADGRIVDRQRLAQIGLAYTAYLALLPGHFMVHGGQELQEDANIFGDYAGENGRTSIFDFVYQAQSRLWNYDDRPAWMINLRERYRELIALKKQPAFSAANSFANMTYVDLFPANAAKEQSQWIGGYIRHGGDETYLVVTNGDPFLAHEATIHFTDVDGQDPLHVLSLIGISNNEARYTMTEIFSRPGWVPSDPAIAGVGIPGWVLFRAGNIPSGIYLGEVPAGTTYVFKLSR